ncbi:LysR family transcriptional regulator [Modestobacter sp. L9-4]|uniref:LysR family transcriptional regulator n=1 Tax=Modestobacter sp. L9-4 TaxID=2851567 RepID=UPI001C74AE5C|nr:LysR family transcriptional regulator [Modestobacter sp. L9-4]QXG75244.1 LysR family transcriptional regulator [Modestobacter sp. L9-4]
MDERKLQTFVTVAEELHFTRAAQRLYATQSTVSATVRALEQELGAALLTRTTRAVTLTDAGRAFLPEAKAALEALDRARASVEPPDSELRGSLALGSLSSLQTVDVAALAGDFRRRYPQVQSRIDISPRGSVGHVDRVKAGSLDLAFAVAEVGADPALVVQPLRTFTLAAFVPEGHPLADREAVGLADLAGEPFIEMPVGFAQRTIVDAAFADQQLQRWISVEVPDLSTIPQYVAHGVGVALLPTALAGADLPVRALPLTGAALRWTLSVVTAAGRPPSRAADAFLQLVPAHVRFGPHL